MSALALVHPTGLLAGELRNTLDRRRELWQELRLLSTVEEEIGVLTEVRGVAAMVQAVETGSFDGVDTVVFCSAIERNRPLFDRLPASTVAVVTSPDAGPEDGHPLVAGVNLETADGGPAHGVRPTDGPRRLVSPHPGTVALAHLLHPLARYAPRRATATLLEPVSTCGKAGLDEVFEQTRGILTFQQNPPREVFPVQMAFNVVPATAPTAGITAHLATVLGSELAVSTQVLRAGVFHSYGLALHVELAADPGTEAVRRALGEHPMNDLAVDPELLGPIDAAARDEVLVGPVEPDPGVPGGYHLWAAMDNLTCGGAGNALAILEAIGSQVVN